MAHCRHRHLADVLVKLDPPGQLEQPVEAGRQQLGSVGASHPRHRISFGRKTRAKVLMRQTEVVGRAAARGLADPNAQMEDDAQEREAGQAPAQSAAREHGGHTDVAHAARGLVNLTLSEPSSLPDVELVSLRGSPMVQALTRLRELTEAYDGALPADLDDLGHRCGLRLDITPLSKIPACMESPLPIHPNHQERRAPCAKRSLQ
jgi:hypothetical protein